MIIFVDLIFEKCLGNYISVYVVSLMYDQSFGLLKIQLLFLLAQFLLNLAVAQEKFNKDFQSTVRVTLTIKVQPSCYVDKK